MNEETGPPQRILVPLNTFALNAFAYIPNLFTVDLSSALEHQHDFRIKRALLLFSSTDDYGDEEDDDDDHTMNNNNNNNDNNNNSDHFLISNMLLLENAQLISKQVNNQTTIKHHNITKQSMVIRGNLCISSSLLVPLLHSLSMVQYYDIHSGQATRCTVHNGKNECFVPVQVQVISKEFQTINLEQQKHSFEIQQIQLLNRSNVLVAPATNNNNYKAIRFLQQIYDHILQSKLPAYLSYLLRSKHVVIQSVNIKVSHDLVLHIEADLSEPVVLTAIHHCHHTRVGFADNENFSNYRIEATLNHLLIKYSPHSHPHREARAEDHFSNLEMFGTMNFDAHTDMFHRIPITALCKPQNGIELVVDDKFLAPWTHYQHFCYNMEVLSTLSDVNSIIHVSDVGYSLYLYSLTIDPFGESIVSGSVRVVKCDNNNKDDHVIMHVPGSPHIEYVRHVTIHTYNSCFLVECIVDDAFVADQPETIQFFVDRDYSNGLHLRARFERLNHVTSKYRQHSYICFSESRVFRICDLSEQDFRSVCPLFFERKSGVELQTLKVNIPRVHRKDLLCRSVEYVIGLPENIEEQEYSNEAIVLKVPGFPSTFHFAGIHIASKNVQWSETGDFLSPLELNFHLHFFHHQASSNCGSRIESISCPSLAKCLEYLDLIFTTSIHPNNTTGLEESILWQDQIDLSIVIDWFTLQFTISGRLRRHGREIVSMKLQYDILHSHKRKIVDSVTIDGIPYYHIVFRGEESSFQSTLFNQVMINKRCHCVLFSDILIVTTL